MTRTTTPSTAAHSGIKLRHVSLTRHLYAELHHIAVNLMRREPTDCSLQSTILVHGAFLTMQRQRNLAFADRPVVLAAAAKIMRRLLVDRARARRHLKRGGELHRRILPPSTANDAKTVDVIELHDALNALRRHCRLSSDIVEMKFFAGLTHEEIAVATGISERTVGEKWRFAKALLNRSMQTHE